MHDLVLYILCGLIFMQTLRYAQRRGATDYVAGAVNYALAAVICLALLAAFAAGRAMPALWPAAGLGAVCGASYFGQFLLLLVSYRLAGVGITTAVMSMGVVVPILLSWCLWSEAMTPLQWAAVCLLPVALLLVRPIRKPLHERPQIATTAIRRPRLTWKADVMLLAVFLNGGAMTTLHKAVNIYSPAVGAAEKFLFFQPSQLVYESFLFLVAAVCSVGYALWRGGRWGRRELTIGTVMGISNVLATLFAVVGLGVLAAAVFFPTATSALIVLSVVISWWLWDERVTPRQTVGLLVAICIVVLANL